MHSHMVFLSIDVFVLTLIQCDKFSPCTLHAQSMLELLNFKAGDRYINIPREIGSKYQNFAL